MAVNGELYGKKTLEHTMVENTELFVVCEDCIEDGHNPILYAADKIDSTTLAVAKSVKLGRNGHGEMYDHDVVVYDSHGNELFGEAALIYLLGM